MVDLYTCFSLGIECLVLGGLMTIQSKPSNKDSRANYDKVWVLNRGHLNAACCDCPKCVERRGLDPNSVYRVVLDLGAGNDVTCSHLVKVK